MFDVHDDILRCWKFDTHDFEMGTGNIIGGRENPHPSVREYRELKKTGFGSHLVTSESNEGNFLDSVF